MSSIHKVQQRLKPWMMPFAMLMGLLFHRQIEAVGWIVPYLIFTMLCITFCRVKPREFDLSPMLWVLLAVQIFGSVAIFAILRIWSVDVAQAAFICVFCPTATAAPVVTGMLGGSIPRVAAYSVLSNLAVAVTAPLIFVWVGSAHSTDVAFGEQFAAIALKVAPLIVFPLGLAFLLYFFMPKVHAAVARVQGVSFYLWSVSLVVVVGRAVSFVMSEPPSAVPGMLAMAAVALAVCVAQFGIGRHIGRGYGDAVSAAQGLAQKNTILAIWMALTYLNPVSSVGPAAYIVWQNTVNSAQLYFKMRKSAD